MALFLDVHSKKAYPANALSNFAPHPFELDGVPISCMETFLQSLKTASAEEQRDVCQMEARAAKEYGSTLHWQESGTLHWNGTTFSRYSHEYRQLLERAYDELTKHPQFAEALRASGRSILWHSIGKLRKTETCLTTFEFIHLLCRARRTVRRRQ